MLHAIERLTNLYDLSKAFGSTIDLDELNQIIVRKAVDFSVAEVGSFWLLEGESAEVVLAATAVNENYEVESPPAAVGGSIVGDLLAEKQIVRRNRIPADDPLAKESEGYPIHSVLAFPLVEEDVPVGALVLVNKRGRHPEFSAEDEELLQDLARQAVRALRNARQYEAEKKVEELDALLTVSREITSTLDLDKVMNKIVNATAALIPYDQCAIAIMHRGKLRLGAISGTLEIDRKDPKIQATEQLVQWVFFGGSDLAVTQEEDGTVRTERPETQEKFRTFFAQTTFRSFHGLLLNDEEGKLGVLAFLKKKPLAFDESNRDLLAILVNQATVAVRNAQLYKHVPLPGFLKPLAEKRRQFLEIPKRRKLAWGGGILLALILLIAVPWRLRVEGPARILPGRRSAVTAGVDGTVTSVFHHEGDTVAAGEVIARLDSATYQSAVASARAAYQIAESDVAKYREVGDSAAMFEAKSRMDEMKAKLALEEDRLARTDLRAPAKGVILTPRIEERVGQLLTKGTEFCVVADLGSVAAEVAVPEPDASLIIPGERVVLKLNPDPTRLFRGTVFRPGSHVREEESERFVVAEIQIENAAGLLKTGMQGKAKVSTVRVPIAVAIFRKPIRYLWTKLWPLLP
jgi:GAF domain-containing protein/biotin carboxyl carrier protein